MQKKKLGTIAGAAIALLVGILGWFASADDSANNFASAQTETSGSQTVDSSDTKTEPQDQNQDQGSTNAESSETASESSSEEDEPAATAAQKSGLPTIALDSLPPEALDTLELIEDKGPYPYRQDNGTFQNRERILPSEHSKYSREFTVETPGSPDRGARRIVTGGDGEGYYTSDHYTSFKEIEGWSWK